jgi:hypothetical protein
MEEERNTGRVIGPVGMWTTDDPRCSQCLRLSQSGWGQPVASSPDRAAPHGGRSSSPARQQLVPMVVPKSETLDRCPRTSPLDGSPPPVSAPSGRVAAARAPSRSWFPPPPATFARPAAARTHQNAERKLAPRAATSVPSLPPELGLTPGSAAHPFTLFHPCRALSSRWHSAGTLHSSAHSCREAGMIAHPLHPPVDLCGSLWISCRALAETP